LLYLINKPSESPMNPNNPSTKWKTARIKRTFFENSNIFSKIVEKRSGEICLRPIMA